MNTQKVKMTSTNLHSKLLKNPPTRKRVSPFVKGDKGEFHKPIQYYTDESNLV